MPHAIAAQPSRTLGLPAAAWPSKLTSNPVAVVALLLLVTLVPRVAWLGNPDYHMDEQFYFVVADRMWHGALPYVDIWDRKPIGLFLIYAALRPFSGDSLFAIQLAGIGSITATAYVVWRIAGRQGDAFAALIAALLYPVWTSLLGGANGQAPVFYNLLIAAAALQVLRAIDDGATLGRRAAVAMLLGGLAIQVKYTAVVEAAFFGLVLSLLALRAFGWKAAWRRILLWAALALLPTAAVWVTYAALGHAAEFVQANFTSIFLRAPVHPTYFRMLVETLAVTSAPMFAVAFAGGLKLAHDLEKPAAERLFLFGWVAAALGGFVAVGNFYDHYALPLVAPLMVLSTPVFRQRVLGAVVCAFAMAWTIYLSPPHIGAATKASRATIRSLAAEARPYLRHGPMYIWDGPSILYSVSGAEIPTRFPFPGHLDDLVEQHALGVDTGAEMRRVLAQRPAVIVTTSRAYVPNVNPVSYALVARAMASDYVELDRRPDGWRRRDYILAVRRDLCGQCENLPPAAIEDAVRIDPAPKR